MIIELNSFLTAEIVKNNLHNTWTITSDVREMDNKFDPTRKRLVVSVKLNASSSEPSLVTEFSVNVNRTSQKEMARVHGTDTQNWIGKVVDIFTVRTAVNGEVKDSIVITPTTKTGKTATATQPVNNTATNPSLEGDLPF